MKTLMQRMLDAAEDFTTRRRWVGLTFQILRIKQRLGLGVWR